jgi:hypothetical protein
MPENENVYYDLPFLYVFDADALTTGADYNELSVPIIGDSDFILRRVAGRNLVAERMRMKDPRGNYRQSNFSALARDYALAPEILYPQAGQISFDLQAVTKAAWTYAVGGSNPNYYSQLVFQGVRRFYGYRTPESTYSYYDKPYTIRQQITVDWTGNLAAAYQVKASPRRFSVYVDNYDFELHRIVVTVQKTGAGATVPSMANAAIKLTLYAVGERALMTAPVVDLLLNGNTSEYNSIFPVPTIFYPAASQILFDITSLLLDTEVPATVWLDFVGTWRFPC